MLDQLVDRQRRIVRLHHGIRDLGGWQDRECGHHPIGELLPDLGDEKRAHARARSAAQRMGDLESLQIVTTLRLTANNVNDLIHQLGAFRVMTLCPIVAGAGLPEHKIIRSEKGSVGAGANRVHGSRFQVDEDRSRDVFRVADLVEIDIHPLQLLVGRGIAPVVGSDRMEATVTGSLTGRTHRGRVRWRWFAWAVSAARTIEPGTVMLDYQKAAPTWLPCEEVSLLSSTSTSHWERE